MSKTMSEKVDLDALEAMRTDPQTGKEHPWESLKAAAWRCEAEKAVPALIAELREARTERDRLKSACMTLGQTIKQQCDDIVKITGSQDLIGEDGDGDWESVWDRGIEMRTQLSEARAAVERVRTIHIEEWPGKPYNNCSECVHHEEYESRAEWPCPTIRALDGDAL